MGAPASKLRCCKSSDDQQLTEECGQHMVVSHEVLESSVAHEWEPGQEKAVVTAVVVANEKQDAKGAHGHGAVSYTSDRALYAWLGVGPRVNTPVYDTLRRCFPGAVPGQVVVKRSAAALQRYGFTPGNTLYGQSLCPDEINNEKGDIGYLMTGYWGECFPMGGIGGAPFGGKTGFTAFAHHVPDDGNVLVLFGPHIAISETGELGKYLRPGQSKHSAACGAVLAAYDAVRSGCPTQREFDPMDMQQSWIKDRVAEGLEDIQSSSDPINALIHEVYRGVRDKMVAISNTNFGSGYLVLIGGIQINLPKPLEDHFEPLTFQIRSKDMPTRNLLHELSFVPSLPPGSSTAAMCADIMSWLTWTPTLGTPCSETLLRCFPGAVPGNIVVKRSAAALHHFYGFTPENTIYGHSLCPDEINHEKGDIGDLMSKYWGECFPMGGIGGAPFVGKTGFSAFAHHVPDDGNVLVLFGPHIAISETGELGKYLRPGQSKHSAACGAVLAAYDAVRSGGQGEFDPMDMQQSWLKDQVAEGFENIQNSSDPINALIHEAYKMVRDKMLAIANTNFGNGYLVLIGGVQINMPLPWEDHFEPLLFRICSRDTEAVDLLPQILLE